MSFNSYLKYLFHPLKETEFIHSSYQKFLEQIVGKKNIDIVPLKDFSNYNPKDRIVIGLRHDVDCDIGPAMKMAKLEYDLNIKSTYFILHTANYYSKIKNNKIIHKKNLLNKIKRIQNEWNHEIGWHNDLVTLQYVYQIKSKELLISDLRWLKTNGIQVFGTAAHGSFFCKLLKYSNNSFFKNFANEDYIYINNKKFFIDKGYLDEFNLKYEAYHLNSTHYFSDCTFIGPRNRRWHPGELDLNKMQLGDKIIINIHPED